MKLKFLVSLILSVGSFSLFAEGYYCPQNHAYINVGMSADDVLSACGKPLRKEESKQPLMRKVPVQQLIYNSQGTPTGFYGVWSVSTGSGGTSLQIDVIDNIVKAITVNGNDSNATSICKGANIKEGDSVGKVYGSCGSPASINNTFIEQTIPSESKPQIWIYQAGQYQPPISLTFIDGKLQSINN